MRGGNLDTLVRFKRPGALARSGRSRVPGAEVLVAECLAEYVPGVGAAQLRADQEVGTAPAVFIIRREPDVETLDTTCFIYLVEDGVETERFAVKSVRPAPKDPRFGLEVVGVGDTLS